MMAEHDEEANNGRVVVSEDGDHDTKWAGKAMQRQNRCFGVALTLCLLITAGFVLFQTVSPAEETPVDEFDNQAGTITNDAKNAKIQKYLDEHGKNHSGKFWYHGGGGQNPFTGRYQGDEQGGHLRDYTTALEKARAKQDAVLKRWQRTHPGEELPEKYKKLTDPNLVQNHYDAALQRYKKKYGELPSGAGKFDRFDGMPNRNGWQKAHGFNDNLQTSRVPHSRPVNPSDHAAAASKGRAEIPPSPAKQSESVPQKKTEDSKEESPNKKNNGEP